MEASSQSRDDIAVIGLSCRFPGEADTAEHFWDFICNGRNAYSENPDRWNPDAFHYGEKKLNTSLPRGGHFMKQDVAAFDANFFNLSKVEAESMDPQQRIVMEVTYESMESAGLRVDRLAGSRTGVFMASFTSDYREMLYRDAETAPLYTATGTSNTSTSNRVSWFFDLRGPSFTVNTACSSSLVACHLACQSLWNGETESAIVGGTSLLLNPDMFLYLSNQRFLAPDGQCKSFDESGDGYARGDGIGVVILKRVADAVRDGDPIRAVIRGSGCNQDGHTKGFTIPSVEAQASLIEETYRKAGLSLAETRYVEAHGTGTQAGDTCEMEGIARTFGQHRGDSDDLLVGSVKSNIGHLEACAGLASLIKCIFILETGVIPPTPSVRVLNPKIRWEEWHLKVPSKQTPWPTDGLRRVSTQGFGYGGTNAHLILDDAAHYLEGRSLRGHHYTRTHPQAQRLLTSAIHGASPKEQLPRLFLFRANDREGLGRVRASLAQHLDQLLPSWSQDSSGRDAYLQNLAFTLASRRSNLKWQTYATASTPDELLQVLKTKGDAWASPEARLAASSPRLGFIFTGQGAQWARMGVELMGYPVFRQSVEESEHFLRETLGCPWSAIDELAKPQTTSRLSEAAYSQTLCTVLQIAIVDLLQDWNVSPTRVAGHSSGEIAAAYCLGALTKQDSLRVAYYRGILSSEMQETHKDQKGAMMAIGASPETVAQWLAQLTRGKVVVACINSPTSVTASGDAAGIDELLSIVQEAGVFGRKLKVDVAYHSHHMQSVSAAYSALLKDLKPLPAHEGRTMHSSVLGGLIDTAELGASNWVRNLISPVRFSEAVSSLILDGDKPAVDMLIEIGPHAALKGPVQETLEAKGVSAVKYTSVVSRGQNAVKTALACAGELVNSSVPVAMDRVNLESELQPSPLVDLPSYPWNRSTRFWAESRLSQEYRLRKHARLPLLGSPCPTMGARERYWRGMVRLDEEPWIRDHEIQGSILYPGAGFLIMAIEAASQQANEQRKVSAFRLRDVHLDAALVVTDNSTAEAILQLRPHLLAPGSSQSSWMEFTVNSSIDGGALRQNCSGLIMIEYEADADSAMARERSLESDTVCDLYKKTYISCRQSVDVAKFYSRLASLGLTYGPAFANLTEIRRTGNGQCTGAVRVPAVESLVPPAYRSHPHVIHPGTLDAIFHLAFAALEDSLLPGPMVPTTIDGLVVAANTPNEPGTLLRGVSQSSPHGFRELISDIDVLDDQSSRAVVQIKGFRCADVSGGSANSSDAEPAEARPISFRLNWKPAIDLLSAEQLRKYVGRVAKQADASSHLIRATELNNQVGNLPETAPSAALDAVTEKATRWFAAKSAKLVDGAATASSASSSGGYVDATRDAWAAVREGRIPSPEKQDRVLREVEKNGALSTLLGALDAYMDLRHHAKPNLSVLELSLDAVPYSIFAALPSRQSILQTAQYAIRVSQDGVQDRIRSQFGSQGSGIDVAVTDFTQKIDETLGKHDVILIFDPGFLHAKLEVVLRNARKLLNPGGKIIVAEVNEPGLYLGTALGCLHWTRNLDVSQSSWTSCLSRFGLTPALELIDANTDATGHGKFQLRLTGSAAESNGSSSHQPQQVTLIESADASEMAQGVAEAVAQRLQEASIPTKRVHWGCDVSQLKGQPCIVLTDLQSALLKDLAPEDLAALQSLFLHAESTLWVTGPLGPDAALITGLARSVCNEAAGVQIRTLEVTDLPISAAAGYADMVARVFRYRGSDTEFQWHSDALLVSRLTEDEDRNEEIAQLLGQGETAAAETTLQETPEGLKLCVRQIGMLDSACYEPDPLALEPLEAGEVEVDVKASGVNFRDVMVALGQIPDRAFGFEGAGVVRRVHAEESRLRPGDRVVFLAHGAHRTVHRVRADYAMPMPDTMSFEEGAAVLLVHTTAWYALVKSARATAGQSVLVHAAAGGVGQAVLMLARHLGLEVFATVGSEEKRKLVHETYGIPHDHMFNSRDSSFAMGVKRMTNGRGVDIVVNSLAGEALRQTWHCLAPFGTFVELGMKDILDNARLDMKPFLQDATFVFFNLNRVQKERPDLMKEALRETMALVSSGALKPATPLTAYAASQVETAFRKIQTGQHLGKLVLTFQTGDVLRVIRPDLSLGDSGAYLLVGGLGGLGRSLARLLVHLGARRLCFLSRSGAKSSEAQALVQELELQHRVRVLVCQGDVSDSDTVARVVQQCTTTLGPIRGVVQCAMILRDGLFERMTHEQWTESTRPKVQGTWNLHEQIPSADFFITLSSFAGVFGSRGQSNYAAAGAYEDALAHFRTSLGQRAITIDLGIMRDVGVLAEQGITDYLREWEEPFGIREHEFHALIKSAIMSATEPPTERSVVQIPTGLATARSAQAAGISTPFYFDDARFSILAQTRTAAGASSANADDGKVSIRTQLSQAQSVAEAASAVQTVLLERVAKTLQSSVSEIDPSQPLHSYGVDSLVAVETVKWMFKTLEAKLTVFDVLSNVSIVVLCEKIATTSTLVKLS
ncbi:Beta-ketoacyl synthase [Metarhizium rileyi]|uniref:Beta-ketoacyl synthase n=1 Tax=Metarhizium rileyi (strain RCEF 4871) TaxID=1649241 RepID=A0A166WX55_METRR|nr:Beta-ketoacyl synthase [Metarhizium rileyi RCEF 4871]